MAATGNKARKEGEMKEREWDVLVMGKRSDEAMMGGAEGQGLVREWWAQN